MHSGLTEWVLTPEELEQYAQRHGNAAAASLLLLCPPDRFAGEYEETFARLTTELTTKPQA